MGQDGPDALLPLYDAAARLVADRAPGWQPVWAAGPAAQAKATGEQLADLVAAVAPHLAEATVRAATPAAGLRWGMCGRLRVWDGMDPVTGKEC